MDVDDDDDDWVIEKREKLSVLDMDSLTISFFSLSNIDRWPTTTTTTTINSNGIKW